MPQFDCSNLISSISYNKFNIKSGFWGKYYIDQNIDIVWEKMMKKMKKKLKKIKNLQVHNQYLNSHIKTWK